MIKIGDQLPDATLFETTEFGAACPITPGKVDVAKAAAGKKIVIFGLPGAYTPTCSAKHVPGFLDHLDELRRHGVDEIWCVSINDGYVMAQWGKDQGGIGKIRFLGDGNAELTKALGLDIDLSAGGMGTRSRRYSMFVDDRVVKAINVEQPGKFEVSDAATIVKQIR
jgi:peroxiredoxin